MGQFQKCTSESKYREPPAAITMQPAVSFYSSVFLKHFPVNDSHRSLRPFGNIHIMGDHDDRIAHFHAVW